MHEGMLRVLFPQASGHSVIIGALQRVSASPAPSTRSVSSVADSSPEPSGSSVSSKYAISHRIEAKAEESQSMVRTRTSARDVSQC